MVVPLVRYHTSSLCDSKPHVRAICYPDSLFVLVCLTYLLRVHQTANDFHISSARCATVQRMTTLPPPYNSELSPSMELKYHDLAVDTFLQIQVKKNPYMSHFCDISRTIFRNLYVTSPSTDRAQLVLKWVPSFKSQHRYQLR